MNLFGMNRDNGSPITDAAYYLKQSVNDIIHTPLGSRVMRRNYGSNMMDFIDSPINKYTLIQIQAYLTKTLIFQEKNFALTKLTVQQKQEKLFVSIEGNYIPSRNTINLLDIQFMTVKK